MPEYWEITIYGWALTKRGTEQIISQLINVVSPVFAIMAVGYFWSRSGQKYDLDFITSVAINLGCPCLAFSTLTLLEIDHALLGKMGMSIAMALLLFAIFGLGILRLSGVPPRGYLPPLMFANIGNMGLPICLFAYGTEGLALAIIVFAVVTVVQFTVGIWLYSGAFSLLDLVKNPVIVSIVISLIILVMGIKPPEWIAKTTKLLGEITIPMMILTLGVSLERMKVYHIAKPLCISLVRIGMGFGVGVGVAYLMGLTGVVRGVLILQCSMPVAVFNYLLAERYKRNAKETAELIVASTVLSLVTLPLILGFLK